MSSLTILGSGSGGNAALLCTDTFRLLIDCGLNPTELKKRMAPERPEKIDAVLLSHEHGDHAGGINGLLKHGRNYGRLIPIYVSSLQVREVVAKTIKIDLPPFAYFEPGLPFTMGNIRVDPFNSLHDCAEGSVAFKFTLPDGTKIGYAVDLGFIPPAMPRKFYDCHTIVIESNYDPAMLDACEHPQFVKDRVSGRGGHLSNEQCAEFLAKTNGSLRNVVLAHLSGKANRPELARSTAQSALDWAGSKAEVFVASQTQPLRINL